MTTSTAIGTPELDVLGARSDSSDRIHTTPAREMSDLPPSQIRITRVYRDLATTYLSHRWGATPRHSRKTPTTHPCRCRSLQRHRQRRTYQTATSARVSIARVTVVRA